MDSLSAWSVNAGFLFKYIAFITQIHWSVLTVSNSISTNDADDTTLMAESEEELKSLLMKVKEESEKVGLKLNI